MQVEKLIKELPSLPADWSNGDVTSVEKGHLSNGIPLQHGESGTNLRDTQSMLLERIASEMNRLKFYMTHAQVYLVLYFFHRVHHNPLNLLTALHNFSLLTLFF